MYMVMYVSRDVMQAEEMLEEWIKVGVKGVTILESAGLQQASKSGLRDDIGIVFSLSKLMQSQEIHHRTLFSAIQDEETLRSVVDVSKKYVGDWSKPDVGVLFVLPILEAYGLDKH
jgi:nitrogen regulatory protein P-II 1